MVSTVPEGRPTGRPFAISAGGRDAKLTLLKIEAFPMHRHSPKEGRSS